MDILRIAAIGIGGVLVSSYYIEEFIMKQPDTVIEKPVDIVSVIMPSYNEETLIEQASSSIRNQAIIQKYPDMFEFILVDSGSTDKTVEIAKPYVDKIIIANRGKLTARNKATEEAKGNIIVSVDSDSWYPKFTLNTLLKPFKEPDIIGVIGHTLDYSIPNMPGQIHTIFYTLERVIIRPNQMPGRLSAYRKEAFYKTGKFNENINQFNLKDILEEEEIMFGNRLAETGKLVFVPNAMCIHLGGIRIACRNNIEAHEKCELLKLGTERF